MPIVSIIDVILTIGVGFLAFAQLKLGKAMAHLGRWEALRTTFLLALEQPERGGPSDEALNSLGKTRSAIIQDISMKMAAEMQYHDDLMTHFSIRAVFGLPLAKIEAKGSGREER